jgi:MFS family permease
MPDNPGERPPSRPWRELGVVVAAVTAITLPTFLVGTLAVQIRASMHFGAAELGVVVGFFYAAAALAAAPSGNLAERMGGTRLLRNSVLASAVSLLLVAGVAGSWPELAAIMVLAGLASSAGQVGSNLFLARRIAPARQGLAFGVKQAAVPLAALLGGLAVPALALTVGWRWAFAGAAALALVSAVALPRPRLTSAQRRAAAQARGPREPAGPLIALALGFGLALTACSSLGAFLVTSAVAGGVPVGMAGLLAALASGTAVAVRVAVGALADRRQGRHLVFVVGMIVVGAAGFSMLSLGSTLQLPVLLLPGAVLSFGVGWGWNGLFNYAVVRAHPAAPGRATGITQTGGRVGSVLGPLLFGILAAHLGYGWAWGLAAVEALSGALVLLGARGMLLNRPARTVPG